MLWVSGGGSANELYVRFLQDRLIARTEWFSDWASIDLASDDAPIGVTIHRYSDRQWPFTEDILTKYHLGSWADDLTTVRDAYFNPNAKPKFEGYKPRR